MPIDLTPTPAMVEAALDAWWDGSAHTLPPGLKEAERRDMSAALTAALAVSGYGEVVEWQSVETAPMDEDVLLGWWQTWPDLVWKQKVGWAAASNTCGHPQVSNAWFDGEATHWRPLPTPPALARATTDGQS